MRTDGWLAYDDLAWTESIIAPPAEYAAETEFYTRLIKENSRIEVKTLLHLGSGAGGNDHTFKRHFRVTGVDISPRMLAIARAANPEVAYVQGDMRDVDLGETFDAVAIPDSIEYMATLPDLRAAINTACRHLKPGGVLLITAGISEEFRNNNFAYSGSRDGIELTVFENNYILPSDPTKYEATFVYLIRRRGELSI
ncbi:MAG: class I SAM-dependent methyltransferase, partial [Bacteroidota bacterium]